jgi:translation initiation factor IF-2
MAEVTVSLLAKGVGTPVDKLLIQMKEAGLSHSSEDEVVSDEDKQTLLAYLQSAHGSDSAEPKKITLKRKTVSTLKAPAAQGKKTVSVEVRKKRTFVKRSPEEIAEELKAEKEREEKAAEDELKAHEEAQKILDAESARRAEAEAAAVAAVNAQKAEKEALEERIRKNPNDPELLRQLASARRKEKEALEAQAREAAIREKAAEAEEKRKAEEALKRKQKDVKDREKEKEKEKEKPAVSTDPVSDLVRKKRAKDTGFVEEEEDASKKLKVKKPKDLAAPRGKARVHHIHVQITDDGEYEEESRHLARRKNKRIDVKQQAFEKPTEKMVHEVEVPEAITVGELASRMNVKAGELIRELMKMGVMATVNQSLDQDTAVLIIEELGHKAKLVSATALEDNLLEVLGEALGTPVPRAPVVTVMGHVDHGKTSLLDYIRKTRVASGEAGGITQHIGAYHVETPRGMITFLDTPGHAAFTAMRARGAKSTDIVILVVAADDGVMPQTIEAVQHARAAGVPVVVAMNKMDKPDADPDRIKSELSAQGVIPEDWGGEAQFVPVSAHTGAGIDALLEAILLQSEVLELKAAADIPARGVVIESRLDKGRGAVTTVLIQAGTLRRSDIVLAGESFGRVRAMTDESGSQIEQAGPSMPVEILGLDSAPSAGDPFYVVESEKKAKEVAEFRNQRTRDSRLSRQQGAKLENLFGDINQQNRKVLNIVLKTDVRGSLEALQGALIDIGNQEVAVNLVASGIGGITENDANLALTSQAVIFGFNVRADASARTIIENAGVDLRYYSVIYDLIDDVKKALGGMLKPELREEIIGVAEVREVFKSPKYGLIAGSMVVEGTIMRNKPIRVLRDNVVIYKGELESLRRFKDDVSEVRNGMECGIGVKGYQDVRPGDKIEVFDTKEIVRVL